MMEDIKAKIEEVENELTDLYTMSEEAACFRYNVDYKHEAIEFLNDELADLYKQLERAEECEVYVPGLDPAFSSWAEFNSMRI